jgi:RNA polymerase sigma-70 factor (ECF subfamily)
MKQEDLIPHLFRTEFSKITAVLCTHFGIGHLKVAEDIASDTFLAALEVWPRKGIPENPAAWLYVAAKNKAINQLSRETVFKLKVQPGIKNDSEGIPEITIDLSDKNITDSQLQMLFAICNPAISNEAQIGLALRILCGFGIEEIADAFLSTKETINKRLYRAREKLRRTNMPIEVPSETEIDKRLETVLTTLYLLFNEGYYSESRDTVLRRDLCLEAMRLTRLLVDNEFTSRPSADALLALMCFHSSRFDARLNEREEPVLYKDQDETLWNRELIEYGGYYLNRASRGSEISKYHLEAGIAYWHTIKADTAEKWETILALFEQLLSMEYSPIAALNRTYALSKVKGKAAAIVEAEKLGLTDNPFYHTLLGELYTDLDNQKAMDHLQKALFLAKTTTDKKLIQNRIDNL